MAKDPKKSLFNKRRALRLEQTPAAPEPAARVQIVPLHHVVFQQEEPPSSAVIRLANLSVTGVGFVRASQPTWVADGALLRGRFVLRGEVYPVQCRVVHATEQIVGCAFEGDTAPIRAMVERYFRLELNASRLLRMDPAFLEPQPDGRPNWLRGEQNCELFYVEDEAGIVRFVLSFFDCWCEARRQSAGHYKMRFSEVGKGGSGGIQVDTLQQIDRFSDAQLDAAQAFVKNIRALPGPHRATVLRALHEARFPGL